jgi:signal transduction histidine kinase
MSAKLTIRMAAPSIMIGLLLLTLGVLGGWLLLRVQKKTSALVALDVHSIRAVEELVFSLYELRSELTPSLAAGNQAALAGIRGRCRKTEEWLREVETLMDDQQEIALAGQIRQGFDRFDTKVRQLVIADLQVKDSPKRSQAEQFLQDTLAPAKDLLNVEEGLVLQSEKKNEDMTSGVAWVLLLLGVCGSTAGLVAGFGIARSVSRSIIELYVPIRAASGKLKEVIGPIDLVPSSRIENLDAILRNMADHIATVVNRLQESQLAVLRTEQLAALGQLAAGMAHELRNPLTAIKILIESAIERGPSSSLGHRDLVVMQRETARLEQSVQTFLEYARPPKLDKQADDLRRTILETLDLIAARAERQRVAVQRELPAEPLWIEADHDQLRQVFLNLFFNALDVLPNGGRLTVTAGVAAGANACRPDGPGGRTNADAQSPVGRGGRTNADAQSSVSPGGHAGPEETEAGVDGWVVVTITDDGPGLSAEIADRVFQPYVSTKETGLGLGLAICRRIVEAHDGEIAVENDPAGGAVFTVRLPCQMATIHGQR